MIKLVEKYEPREYTALSLSSGVVLCDRDGAFIVLRFSEDVERLKKLLDSIEIKRGEK
jgi:hypothetical protein